MFCYRLVTWVWFDRVVIATVIANVIVMALKHAGEATSYATLEQIGNEVFTVFFVMETAVKVLGLGLRQFFFSSFNALDFCLALGGVASAAVSAGRVGMILRVFRVLRVFRLVEYSRTLQVRSVDA